jgi:hypothetical protein
MLDAPRPTSSWSGEIRWRRLAASVCATEIDSTKPMIEIRIAGPTRSPISPRSKFGSVSGGSPCGTSPTISTPFPAKSKAKDKSVVTATAATGPAFARTSARRGFSPSFRSSGFRPLRTQNRKAIDPAPTARVMRLVSPTWEISVASRSNSASPWAGTPRTCFICEVAMSRPEAVMNPAITGCDRKFARNPSRNTPITIRTRPDRNASVIAAAAYSAGVSSPRFPMAAAVMSEITATGPTASARDVPKIA